ncbi:Asa1p [Malassezia vespertilionis]|uniref:ASTRA-associated protein 1 n=1 Tax=Malassezia vespertilionis TaxID=2020962 RepID=A0A2N1JFD1_9BASI|nr:Asa1p [Malassezia vespertilionis]
MSLTSVAHRHETPVPFWVLRHHTPSPVNSVSFANNNTLLVAGDAQGRVSVSSMVDYRPQFFWDAHKDSILRADAWEGYLVTHGRDNCVRVWATPETALNPHGGTTALGIPKLVASVEVNALNYYGADGPLHGWLAVPNILESAWIDIFQLPQRIRVAEAVGKLAVVKSGAERPAIVMGLCLEQRDSSLVLAAGYEDGSAQAWTLPIHHEKLGQAELLWSSKEHTESVMSMCLTPDKSAVLTVGADDLLVYTALTPNALSKKYSTQHPGNACVAMRADAHVVAVGSWDSFIRILSMPEGILLAKLAYHKDSVYSLAYARFDTTHTLALGPESSSEDESVSLATKPTPRLMAAGAKDGRITLWDTHFTTEDARW